MASKISTGNDPGTCKPTQRELDWISKRAGDNWRSLLTNLGVDLDVIRGYYQSNSGNTINAVFEGLVFWVKGNAEEPVSYETLFEALKEANLSSCASDLEKKLRTTSLSQQSTGDCDSLSPTTQLNEPGNVEEGGFSVDNPRNEGPSSMEVATLESPASPMMTRVEKIKRIVDLYRKGKLRLPSCPDLECDFAHIMGSLNSKLSSASPDVRLKIQGTLCSIYETLIYGIGYLHSPEVPSTAPGLYKFIKNNSNPYEVFLVKHTVDKLKNKKLKHEFVNYNHKLCEYFERELKYYKQKNVTLPSRQGSTHMAVAISEEQVLLSLIIHLKQYFSTYLGLRVCLLDGFTEGCTVFYFAITIADAMLLAPKVLSHLAELKRFKVTHIIVFGHFAVDVCDKFTIEWLPDSTHKETEVALKEAKAALDEASIKSEHLKNSLMSQEMKLKAAMIDTDMFKNSTVKLARQKFELENQLHNDVAKLQKENESLRAESSKLKNNTDKLTVGISQQEDTIDQLEAEVERLHKDNKSLGAAIEDWKAENERLKAESSELHNRNDELAKEIFQHLHVSPESTSESKEIEETIPHHEDPKCGLRTMEDFGRLDERSCKQILFQIEGSGILSGIERGGFTAALLGGEHYNLFSDREVQQFTNAANNSDLFKPIRSACQRLGGWVLWAVYNTLLSTSNSPGAVQHADIASKLQESVFQSLVTTADRDTGDGPETLSSGDVPSLNPGHGARDQSRTMVNTASSLGDQGTEGNKQNESVTSSLDWNSKEFVARLTDHLVDGMNRDEYQALAHEILDDLPLSDCKVIKRKIHAAVLQRNVSLYEIGRFLLARQILYVHIFKITEFTKAPITKEEKQILKDHLGLLWEQLAYRMGMTRSKIDDIKAENHKSVGMQIDKYLNGELQFPRFPTMGQTASLLVEIMEMASIPEVAKDVRQGFLSIFLLKEDDVYPGRSDVYQQVDLQSVMHGEDECEDTSSGLPGGSDPQSKPQSSPETTTGNEDSEEVSPLGSGIEQQFGHIICQVDEDHSIDICEDELSETALLESIKHWIHRVSLVRKKDKKQIVHFAAELGYVQILTEVLQAGHNGRAIMERGMTPFLLACEAGKLDIVEVLYQKYGYVILCEKDDCGRTCLHFPEVYRNEDLFRFLVWDTADVDASATSNTGVTPLSVACLAGSIKEVNELLVKISTPEKPRPSRMPPLHCAALSNNYAVLRYLIEQDYPYLSDPDSKSHDGYTALHIAAARGNMDIVQYLVDTARCSVNETSADGSSALLLAAICNHAEIALYLIDRGAALDYNREIQKGRYHITPLGEAVLGRNLDVAILLIEKGADIFFKSGGTTSILDHACIGGSEEIVQILLAKLLESYPIQAGNVDMLQSAFQVSVDFKDFKIANLIVKTMKRKLDVSTAEEVFEKFKGKSESGLNYLLPKAVNQYTKMMKAFPPEDLPNEGDTCRHVAGGRSTVLYHIGYDDGPHWGTEQMHVCLLFEDFKKHERFRTAYKRVYMEATKCVINNVVTFNNSSWESLASEAQSSGNPSAVQFYSNPKLHSRYADPELFIQLGHAGVPSAINMACSMVSQNMIEDGFGMHGLTADQYFAEVIKREKEHPGTFGLKYQCPGSEPAGGVRLRGISTVQTGRQQSYTSLLPTAFRVTSSPSWQPQSARGGYVPVDGGQQTESSFSIEQQLQPSKQQLQSPSSADQQVQSLSSGDQQVQLPSSGYQQLRPSPEGGQ